MVTVSQAAKASTTSRIGTITLDAIRMLTSNLPERLQPAPHPIRLDEYISDYDKRHLQSAIDIAAIFALLFYQRSLTIVAPLQSTRRQYHAPVRTDYYTDSLPRMVELYDINKASFTNDTQPTQIKDLVHLHHVSGVPMADREKPLALIIARNPDDTVTHNLSRESVNTVVRSFKRVATSIVLPMKLPMPVTDWATLNDYPYHVQPSLERLFTYNYNTLDELQQAFPNFCEDLYTLMTRWLSINQYDRPRFAIHPRLWLNARVQFQPNNMYTIKESDYVDQNNRAQAKCGLRFEHLLLATMIGRRDLWTNYIGRPDKRYYAFSGSLRPRNTQSAKMKKFGWCCNYAVQHSTSINHDWNPYVLYDYAIDGLIKHKPFKESDTDPEFVMQDVPLYDSVNREWLL